MAEGEYIMKIELIKGDCLEKMKDIADKSIDICITDIPYGISFSEWDVLHNNTNSALLGSSPAQEGKNSFKRRGKPINGWSKADKNIPYEYYEWCVKWANELFRITKEGSPILIFSSRRLQHRAMCALEDCGFMIRDVLIWEKDTCNAKAQHINLILNKRDIFDAKYDNYRLGNLAPYYEPIIFAMKPYKTTLTDCVLENGIGGINCIGNKIPSNIINIKGNKKNIYHETEKPVELIEKLIEIFSIDGSHTIIDFTMGSGTTGIACMNMNRNFIGIERDDKCFDVGVNRVRENLKDTYELVIRD